MLVAPPPVPTTATGELVSPRGLYAVVRGCGPQMQPARKMPAIKMPKAAAPRPKNFIMSMLAAKSKSHCCRVQYLGLMSARDLSPPDPMGAAPDSSSFLE